MGALCGNGDAGLVKDGFGTAASWPGVKACAAAKSPYGEKALWVCVCSAVMAGLRRSAEAVPQMRSIQSWPSRPKRMLIRGPNAVMWSKVISIERTS